MAPFVEKYTQRQRDALAHAYGDRKIRPASRVAAMAAAGELELDGERVEPFEVGDNYIRDLARKLAKRRRGEVTSQLADQAPRDAIEALRKRLVNVADAMLLDIEARKPSAVDPERLRQIIRCVREAAAIPGPNDPRPKPPGAKEGGKRQAPEGETRGGLAGTLLAEHRNGDTAPSPPPQHNVHSETGNAAHDHTPSTGTTDNQTDDQDHGSPGALVRELAASHLGGADAQLVGVDGRSGGHIDR